MNKTENIKFYCVDCGGTVTEMVCSQCGRKYDLYEDIPCFLTKEDLRSDEFSKYLSNYDTIARDDIDEDIMPEFYKIAQAKKLLKYCGRKLGGRVLDVGSGKGYFLELVPHQKKMGVDISLDYLKLLRSKGINGIFTNAERLPFKDEFDVVVLTDILEHVYYPERVMQSVNTALKDDGIVIVRVPYREDISVYDMNKGFKYELCHLRSFDVSSLNNIITKNGFILKRMTLDGFSVNKLRGLFAKWPFSLLLCKERYKFWDRQICNLPNWIGKIFTKPIELVAIMGKK